MAAGHEPNDARTAGAQAVARLLPNRPWTAAVSTTTPAVTGSGEVGPSTSRLREGSPCAVSVRHITGSHDTMTSRLTCCATQAPASSRVAAC